MTSFETYKRAHANDLLGERCVRVVGPLGLSVFRANETRLGAIGRSRRELAMVIDLDAAWAKTAGLAKSCPGSVAGSRFGE